MPLPVAKAERSQTPRARLIPAADRPIGKKRPAPVFGGHSVRCTQNRLCLVPRTSEETATTAVKVVATAAGSFASSSTASSSAAAAAREFTHHRARCRLRISAEVWPVVGGEGHGWEHARREEPRHVDSKGRWDVTAARDVAVWDGGEPPVFAARRQWERLTR